ncbi:MAG: CsbD family protein [Chromatiaceae bacterium]|nr:MAG: CsbD family protein [Chromatiaceae bacterium]
MNWEQVRGNWEQAKGELKVRWGKLTDDDLTAINGERDKLIGSLQEKYGITKEAAMKQIDEMT